MLKGGHLYRRNYEGLYLKCLNHDEAADILKQFHDKYGTENGLAESIAHLIIRSGYYWLTVFRDAQHHVRKCFICQTSANKEMNPTMPLQLVYEIRPFAKWGLNFIGPVNPPSSTRHRFILTMRDYCTRWIEA